MSQSTSVPRIVPDSLSFRFLNEDDETLKTFVPPCGVSCSINWLPRSLVEGTSIRFFCIEKEWNVLIVKFELLPRPGDGEHLSFDVSIVPNGNPSSFPTSIGTVSPQYGKNEYHIFYKILHDQDGANLHIKCI